MNAPARRTFFLLLFLCASKEKVNPKNKKEIYKLNQRNNANLGAIRRGGRSKINCKNFIRGKKHFVASDTTLTRAIDGGNFGC